MAQNMTIPARIKRLRENLEWNQARLGSEAFGYKYDDEKEARAAQTRIGKLETGAQEIKVWELQKIADALGVTIQSFFSPEPQDCKKNKNISHIEIIGEFVDRKWGRDMNKRLVIIEKDAPERKDDVDRALLEISKGTSPYVDIDKEKKASTVFKYPPIEPNEKDKANRL